MTTTAATTAAEIPVVWRGRRLSAALLARDGKGWQKVHREGHCRLCLRPSHVRLLTRHHLVPQGWFRRELAGSPYRRTVRGELRVLLPWFVHADANIVPLCGPCHLDVERDRTVRLMLRRRLSQAEIAFAVQVAGKPWFDRRYPDRR